MDSLFHEKRILIVDDNESIHEDFRKVLLGKESGESEFEKAKFLLFDENPNLSMDTIHSKENISKKLPIFKLDSAFQGQEALGLVKTSLTNKLPYALAFVDIRMPPGWNGAETIKHIWEVDPDIQIVICTAYSDFSWEEISQQFEAEDNLLILKKPFDSIEICQLATTLTKKWELKKRIQHHIDNLESIVQQRTVELRDAKELAEKANQIKSEFLSNMSLELRTPLNNIVGFTELMVDKKINPSDSDSSLLDILSSAKQLTLMVDDMLDISKIESANVNFRPEKIDLKELADDIKNIFLVQMRDKQHTFNISVDNKLQTIENDPNKIKKIIYHFISNAVKFTPEGGKIALNLKAIDENNFKIEVKDNGIGIDKKQQLQLFNSFQQLDSSITKRYSGAGLGLAMIKMIVDQESGEVGVESELGKGSTFFAILPRKLN